MPKNIKELEERMNKRLTVYFTAQEKERLNKISEKTKFNKTKIARQAINDWIEKNAHYYNHPLEKNTQQINNCSFTKAVESILNHVTELLDAEMGGVMLYDSSSNELVLQKPAFGLDKEEEIEAYRIPIDGKGNAATVFQTGVATISNNTLKDPRFLKKFVIKYGARNNITVPLEVNTRRIGVMHINNKKTGDFTIEDLNLLKLLSSHLALLLENTTYYENAIEQSNQLKIINYNLKEQQDRLHRMIEIHVKLIRKVLNGEGLQAITLTLSELLGCTIIIEDKHLNVVCTSSEELDDKYTLRSLKQIQPIQDISGKSTNNEIHFIKSFPDKGIYYSRAIIALTDKNNVLGYLSVIHDNVFFDDLNKIAIEQAALIASLELVKERIAFEIETNLKGEFLSLVLDGDFSDNDKLLSRAKFLDYDIISPQIVAIIKIYDNNMSIIEDCYMLRQTIKRLITLINANFHKCITLTRGNELIMLIPCEDRVRNRLSFILNEINDYDSETTIKVAIGGQAYDISAINDSYIQARRVLSIIEKFNFNGDIINYEQIGVYNLLFNIDNDEWLKSFLQNRIGTLLEYENKKKMSLVATLESYLNNKCKIKAAADELFIHVRTMQYRLKRIEEITNLDLSNSDVCFELNMCIKIYKIFNNDI